MKKVVIVLAPGFEETEAVMTIDLLRRAGFEVRIAGLSGLEVNGSRNIRVQADILLKDLSEAFDALVLPGGMPGAKNLAESSLFEGFIGRAFAEKWLVAAICAAPAVVLASKGYLKGRRFTCFTGREKDVQDGIFCAEPVVKDGQLITSRGPGTTADFAFEIIRTLADEALARQVFEQALFPLPGCAAR